MSRSLSMTKVLTVLAIAIVCVVLLDRADRLRAAAMAMQTFTLAHHDLRADQLVEPFASRSASNGPNVIPQPPGARLVVPPGFRIEPYAGGFRQPRMIAQAANGDVLVVDSRAGQIVILRDAKGGGKIDTRFVFASGLEDPPTGPEEFLDAVGRVIDQR